MTNIEKYENLAAELFLKARAERSEHVRAQLEGLARCYLVLAERTGRSVDTSGPAAAT